ncbi:hypothetical protein FGLOB1_3421 [Fusarium globosum]|uniref:Uncharacterized protein n=1 Tax=Fusarium globosum TaxID=78864 RepID=A0A8H6DF46_9HYPO|nr:hypothetical protein FGLOB1_3421 [Fusarium globosum]
MASPSTLMTVTSPTATATLDALTQHYHGKPNHSDKIVIIGLTVGMVALFLLFIAPCCCMHHPSGMSDTSVVIAIAVSCAALVVIFFAAICFCHWRSRPKSPTGTSSRDHDDSDANSDVEMDAIPDDALNHPLVRGSNGAGHVYPVFEATRERHAHAQN